MRIVVPENESAMMHLASNSTEAWTAFLFFQKGMPLVYAGQEKAVSHLPSLFDKDTVQWNGAETVDLNSYITKLAEIKRSDIFTDSAYQVKAVGNDALVAAHEKDGAKAVGIFPLKGQTAFIPVDMPDGVYCNLIDGAAVEVFRGGMMCFGKAVIIIRNSECEIRN